MHQRRATETTAWNADASAVRRMAKLIRTVLKKHPDVTSGELADLVKDRLRVLRIPWTPRQLHDALSAIDQRVTGERIRPPCRSEVAQQVDPPWPKPRQVSPGWTSLRDLATQLTGRSKGHSGRST